MKNASEDEGLCGRHLRRVGEATWMTAVALAAEKTGGLSFTSEMSTLMVTVEDMAGEPLSNACTASE